MSLHHTRIKHVLAAFAAASIMMLIMVGSVQAAPPVKLILESSFGREVNLTETNLKAGPTLEDLCTTNSGDTCQPGSASAIAGGFTFPESVAGAPDGSIYVADQGNARIDELTSSGEFVLMFGKGVDPTAANKDICTAVSKDICGAGVRGDGPGQVYAPESIAVDPLSQDVYVAETVQGEADGQLTVGQRVQKFTAGGEFLFEIGKEVNESTKGNLCAKEEKCTAPAEYPVATNRVNGHGAFDFASFQGDLIAVGGEHDRVYVAGDGGIQEFEQESGIWAGEITVPGSEVTGIAIESGADVIYAIYGEGSTIHRLEAEGHEISSFAVSPREAEEKANVRGIAIDRTGHLALAVLEEPHEGNFGALYEAATGDLLTEFTFDGQPVKGISFNQAETPTKEPDDELFAAGETNQDVLSYHPVPVAELLTGSGGCAPGSDNGSLATFDCAVEGLVNPYSVDGTKVWFEFGSTCALGAATAKQQLESVTEALTVHTTVAGLRPNGTLCYRLAGEDDNVQSPEELTAEKKELKLPTVQPRIVGKPSVSFVKSASAVLYGELNPENDLTEYAFEYGPCAKFGECSDATHTAMLSSKVYGSIGATLEVTGLQPATTYRFRLFAINEMGEKAECSEVGEGRCEGSFTTATAPVPRATTEGVMAVGATSAVVSGTIDPDGQPATYAFELGLYAGATTQYGVVQSGSTETVPVREILPLSGLQPGTEYAYRITVKSGYGTATGESARFVTAQVPVLELPAPVALLPIPAFKFPTVSIPKVAKCKQGYTRDKQGKCVRTKKKASKKARGKSRKKKK